MVEILGGEVLCVSVLQGAEIQQANSTVQKSIDLLEFFTGHGRLEDSDFTNLFSSNKSTKTNLVLDSNQVVLDNFLGSRLYWMNENN